jgi:hypothetical protein
VKFPWLTFPRLKLPAVELPQLELPLWRSLPWLQLPFLRLPFFAALLAALLLSSRAAAQVDPRGPVRTIATPHLRIHYPAHLDSLARLSAVHAERAYEQLSGELAAPRGVIDLLLADNTDVSNGYAQLFPSNRVVVFAVPPIGSRELRFHDDWLRLVITHELAHVFHLDRARGLWRVGRQLFGRNPLFFPNAFTPSWVKEGVAVHYESAFTGSGRLAATEFASLLHAAAVDGDLVPYGRWSLSASRWPRGQAAYGYGSTLIEQAVDHAAQRGASGGDSTLGMRKFVDATAGHLVPFLLDRSSRVGFGARFSQLWRTHVDSLQWRAAAESAARNDEAWRDVSGHGWYAAAPRWLGNDSLVWSASTGREVTGLYVAPVAGGAPRRAASTRLAWRNGLDVNVPIDSSAEALVFAQLERRDPYVVRSDLYVRSGNRERRLTVGARLTQPDVRRDGVIVAVQYQANASRLVRVSANGDTIVPLSPPADGERWAEPRWSPDGGEIAAVQLIAGGVQRVVALDADGALRRVVTGARGVFASPTWTPDGARLVWASDRSGRMQLETAPRGGRTSTDTLDWRSLSPNVRQASRTVTSVYEPSVSPDGRHVAALVQRGDGFHVSVAPLDTMGPVVESRWYEPVVRDSGFADSARVAVLPSGRYAPLRQLWPRYWLPLVGEGRRGDATLGVSTSGVDILERHAWAANVLVAPQTRETDVFSSYRYAGLGVPVFDASFNQEWDGTFRVLNDSGASLGTVARRRRFLTASATAVVPRVRWSLSNTVGAQYELRDFTAAADSILGPAGSPLRSGTRYPGFFVNSSFSTARLALRGVSVEEGITLSQSTAYRWREDVANTGSWRTLLAGRGYLPLPLPGYARHVLALRAVGGVADERTQAEFSVGGTSGVRSELLPGVSIGDPARAFPVRGTPPGVQRGSRALGGSVEYRAPLVMFRRLPGPFTLYGDRLSMVLFSDAARAWCPASLRANTAVCLPNGVRDGWLASAGAEVVLDVAVQYDVPYRVRVGAAAPYVAPPGVTRGGSFYVTLGGYF